MKSFTRDILTTTVIAVLAFFLLHATIQSCIVVGPSMEPTVIEEQRLIVNKIVYYFHHPERGDIIVFQPPNKQQPDYIKRLIGLPGDTLEIRNGVVYINGEVLNEPYIKDTPHYSVASTKIPEDSYFVLGDNRNNSNDSHNGWTIPKQNIIGKAWLRIWPPQSWGLVPNYPLEKQLIGAFRVFPPTM
ncbi:MAG: signal peptidase I [Chloroflexota bacterium]